MLSGRHILDQMEEGFATDPAVSEAQRRAMQAAAHGTGKIGIPQSVGAEFAKADPGGSLPERARDMEKSDWRGFLRGLLKFFAEEATDPEHEEELEHQELDPTHDEIKWVKSIHPPDEAEDEQNAAGMMFMTGDGQALFLRRAGDGDHLGEWGFPGGNAEDAETPLECLMRETQEETGHDCAGHDDIISAVDHSFSDTGQYLTFGHLVDAPFEPKLNEEHSEHVWRPIDDPPEPLHPGVRATLDKVGDAARKATAVPVGPREVPADAGTSEGARKAAERRNHAKHADLHGELGGKASGFEQDKHYQASGAHSSAANYKGAFGEPRWQALSERAHKASEALGIQSRLPDAQRVLAGDMLAFDRGLEKRSYDENGHLHVAESNLTKCTVSPYMGEEIPDAEKLGLDPKKKYQLLRAQDELEKPETIASFNGKPVLFQHKMATAVDFPTGLTIGSTGTEAKYEHPYLKNSLSIWPEYASQAVEAGDKSQLSAGYSYTADMTPGIHDGTPYDGVMRNIRGQHIAIVNEGRSGPDVRVEDSSIEDKQWMLIEEALAAL